MIFFLANCHRFEEFVFGKEIFYYKFPMFWENFAGKILLILKMLDKFCHNYLQHEKILKIFLLSYFEYNQIWLNNSILDDHH
jgi:hypothetical protein